MTDRELLELAAKAAGLDGYIHEWINGPEFIIPGENPATWTPLTDDGDALRLAVKLNMNFTLSGKHAAVAQCGEFMTQEFCNGDAMQATRRAITRAAAEIQRAKEAT